MNFISTLFQPDFVTVRNFNPWYNTVEKGGISYHESAVETMTLQQWGMTLLVHL